MVSLRYHALRIQAGTVGGLGIGDQRLETEDRTLESELLRMLEDSEEKIPSAELEKIARRRFSAKRKDIRSAIKHLVSKGHLLYTYVHGHSFLEKSFDRAVRVSEHVVLKPSGIRFDPEPGDAVVEISQGASFGTGEHPTTRLAIRGLEYALGNICFSENQEKTVGLDIGTGSGVLALVALLMGIDHAVGVDTDPCARYEARTNAAANGLGERFEIWEGEMGDMKRGFDLIMANLRYPTLARLAPEMADMARNPCVFVFSGIRQDEASDMIRIYTEEGFRCEWRKYEKGWAGLVFLI